MKRTAHRAKPANVEREALRRRVAHFYRRFNEADWDGCFAQIDPQLTESGKVNRDAYAELMRAFKDAYGSVHLWFTRLSLHLQVAPKQIDKRPFAYAYVIWQDEVHGFHMFRERWIKDNGQWFTRVVGLVPNRRETAAQRD